MAEKFRSLKAFQEFENRTLGATVEEANSLSPLRVLGVLKKHPRGLRRADLPGVLGVPAVRIEPALAGLQREELLVIEPGSTPDDDLLKSP